MSRANSRAQKIRLAIQAMVIQMIPVQTVWGIVKEVAPDETTCIVESSKSKGFEYFDVLLSLDPAKAGITLVPAVNSKVLIGLIENLKNAAFVLRCEEVDHVKLHGDQYGGLIKVNELTSEVENRIDLLIQAIVAGFTALSGLDASASLNAFNSAAQGVLPLDKSMYENDKVKHG